MADKVLHVPHWVENGYMDSMQQPSRVSNPFQRMDQPLAIKIAVMLGGLGLIGSELWWFL